MSRATKCLSWNSFSCHLMTYSVEKLFFEPLPCARYMCHIPVLGVGVKVMNKTDEVHGLMECVVEGDIIYKQTYEYKWQDNLDSNTSHEENKAENICSRVIGIEELELWSGGLLEKLTGEVRPERSNEVIKGKLKETHYRKRAASSEPLIN